MEYFCFVLKPSVSIENVWEVLYQAGFQLLYSSEESSGEKCIYGYPPERLLKSSLLQTFHQIDSFHKIQFDEVDWGEQWGSKGSSIYFDLEEYSGKKVGFLMDPGPGFGDLSHPTTRLTLRMMAPLVADKFVIDLGCGSGVLSLAAIQLGAAGVCGIDIDLEALEHAKKNAVLNNFSREISFQLPTDPLEIPSSIPVLLVMNMIYKEQEQAWNSLPQLHSLKMDCITSGVLKQQKKLYLELTQRWGWLFKDSYFEDKWCGFHFITLLNT